MTSINVTDSFYEEVMLDVVEIEKALVKERAYPCRRPRQPKATMRFETGPGEQAQVDWGVVSYKGEDGRKHRMRACVKSCGNSFQAT